MNAKTSKWLDYLPPVIAFVAALGELVGVSKWDEQAQGLAKPHAKSIEWRQHFPEGGIQFTRRRMISAAAGESIAKPASLSKTSSSRAMSRYVA